MPKAYEPHRWTLNNAAKEFAIDPKTLTKALTLLSIQAGGDGKYSNAEICAAKFGDLAGEKLGKAKAEREAAEIKAALAKGEAVLAADAEATLADYGAGVRSLIESAKFLTEEQKQRIFAGLENLTCAQKP